jgi:primosomal replication protein N
VTANEIALTGELSAIDALRYTPAGIPILGFKLLHRSQQFEAGLKRQVECEVNGVAMAEVAVTMSRYKVGGAVQVKGFMNRKNRMSAQLILHATAAQAIEE